MTPAKCAEHEYRPGENADGPRYTKALRDQYTCPKCIALAVLARMAYRFNRFMGWDKM